MGIDIEKLEKRVNRLEGIIEDVLRERLLQIEMRLGRLEARLDVLYEKTERDKTELIERMERGMASLKVELTERMERDKAELIERMERDKTGLIERMVSLKVELIERMERDKRTIILWFIGVMLAFSTLNITALWAILSFAGK